MAKKDDDGWNSCLTTHMGNDVVWVVRTDLDPQPTSTRP
jgi:hypothetical protein